MSTSIPPRPFYFLRHGQTDWNLAGRMQGHTDIPLNTTGITQAHAAASRLAAAPITRIVSSPLLRALKTAAVTAEAIKLPIHIDSSLMERTFGNLEGRLVTEALAERNATSTDSPGFMPEDGEQWPQTLHRATTTISHWLNAYPDDTLLFVGHGGFFRALHSVLMNERLEAANATPYHYNPTATDWNFTTL